MNNASEWNRVLNEALDKARERRAHADAVESMARQARAEADVATELATAIGEVINKMAEDERTGGKNG